MPTKADPVRVRVRDLLSFCVVAPFMALWYLWCRLRGRIVPPVPLPVAAFRAAYDAVRPRARGELSEIVPEQSEPQGLCWLAQVSPWIPDDRIGTSRIALYEVEGEGGAERELGPAHCGHAEIRTLGGGRFSHWGRWIYFSTSDGSDPRTNGRRYRFEERSKREIRDAQRAHTSSNSAVNSAVNASSKASASPEQRVAPSPAPIPAPVLAPVPPGAPAALDRKPGLAAFRCPATGQPLRVVADQRGEALATPDGSHRYPIVNGIPRFVSSDQYVASFSFEWNTHATTQLDSKQVLLDSARMLTEKTGLDATQVRGKLVLDAGVGSGRYSEALAEWGATVVGVDLSLAVEASHRNLGARPEVLIAQADIGALPLAEGAFDYIISIGVLHHTPSTRDYFLKLPKLLKPGGEIAIWVYPNLGDYEKRNAWIPFCSRIPSGMFHGFCKVLVHLTHRRRGHWMVRWIASVFPISDQPFGLENDILDTFDSYSPRYHGTHSEEEVVGWFREAGLTEIRTFPAWKSAVRGRRA